MFFYLLSKRRDESVTQMKIVAVSITAVERNAPSARQLLLKRSPTERVLRAITGGTADLTMSNGFVVDN